MRIIRRNFYYFRSIEYFEALYIYYISLWREKIFSLFPNISISLNINIIILQKNCCVLSKNLDLIKIATSAIRFTFHKGYIMFHPRIIMKTSVLDWQKYTGDSWFQSTYDGDILVWNACTIVIATPIYVHHDTERATWPWLMTTVRGIIGGLWPTSLSFSLAYFFGQNKRQFTSIDLIFKFRARRVPICLQLKV